MKKKINYKIQDIPIVIQKILIKYGAKRKLTDNGFLRYFNLGMIHKFKNHINPQELLFLIDHCNCYLVISKDEKTVITMGRYDNF